MFKRMEIPVDLEFCSVGQIDQNISWQPDHRLELPLLQNGNSQDIYVYCLLLCELATVSFDDTERPLCKLTLNWADFSDYNCFGDLNKFSNCFSDCSIRHRRYDPIVVYHPNPTLKLDDAYIVDGVVCEENPICHVSHNMFLLLLDDSEWHTTCVDSTIHNLCHQPMQLCFASGESFSWR